MNIDKFEKGKDEYLAAMGITELENYIDKLIQQYFENCFKRDKESSKANVEELYQVINLFRTEYPMMNHYINYRFIIIGNSALHNIFNDVVYTPKNKIAINDKATDIVLQNLFDDELMTKILVEENMYNIHKFIQLLDDLNKGVGVTANYSVEDNKIPRVLYDEINELILKIKQGNYDNIENLDDDFLSDDNPYTRLK